jgi:predicted MFS family arabinose efflux permease
MGMAPMTMAPLAAWLVTVHDWRTAMLIIAGIAAVLMIPAALLGAGRRRSTALRRKRWRTSRNRT